jgi:xylan 1,4-beta-xylosidase
VTPPADHDAWATLIRTLVSHWVDRYGIDEVRQWFFEVWNEPNIPAFWTGTRDDYFKLYGHTVRAIKSVDASLRVGGPATAKAAWIEELLDYCKKNSIALDFISTHIYPTDPLGFEGADTEEQLANSPRDLLRDRAKAVHEHARDRPVYFTEWNISSNPRDHYHDEPFAAAYAAKIALETDPFVDGYSFWTFTDIFEENYFPSIPFHGGFGLLNLYGVPKPVYRAFQLLHALGTEQFPVVGTHETVDTWVVRKGSSITVFLTNHAQPRHAIVNQVVEVRLADAAAPPNRSSASISSPSVSTEKRLSKLTMHRESRSVAKRKSGSNRFLRDGASRSNPPRSSAGDTHSTNGFFRISATSRCRRFPMACCGSWSKKWRKRGFRHNQS